MTCPGCERPLRKGDLGWCPVCGWASPEARSLVTHLTEDGRGRPPFTRPPAGLHGVTALALIESRDR